jgi:threonine dehydratase
MMTSSPTTSFQEVDMNSDSTSIVSQSPLGKFLMKEENEFVLLKEELRLTTNSYKIRGVTSFFQSSKKLPRSIEGAGNLALATAYECKGRAINCTAVVPKGISEVKKKRLLSLGSMLDEREFDEIWDLALQRDMRNSEGFLHPLNLSLITGYGKIAREIHEEMPDCDGLVIPYGLGGLALGIVRELKAISSAIPVFICEISGHAPFSRAQISGKPVRGPKLKSFIEAMGTPEIIPDVFAEIVNQVEDTIVVNEKSVRNGIRALFLGNGIRAEGAAGAAFSAAIELKKRGRCKPVAVLTGGNISDDIFNEITRE